MDSGKVAIITGSSRGIGAEAAKLLAKHGYSVASITSQMTKLPRTLKTKY